MSFKLVEFELYLFRSLIILNFILSLYLITFWYPSKLIKVALPFFSSFLVIFPEILSWLPDKLMGKPLGY